MRLLFTAVVAAALAVGAAWYFGWIDPTNTATPKPPPEEVTSPPEIGGFLYTPAPEPDHAKPQHVAEFKSDPVVMPGVLAVWDKQKVPSPRDGILLFVGKAVTQEDPG